MSDWKATVDPSSGRTYYYNKVTQVTSWDVPEGFNEKGDSTADDAANWKATVDPASGRTYYYNKVTQVTAWDAPACMQGGSPLPADKDISSSSSAAQPAASEAKAVDGGEWVPTVDPGSGKTYWFNKTTRETTWDDPYAEAAPEAAPQAQAQPQARAQLVDSSDDEDQEVETAQEQTPEDPGSNAQRAKMLRADMFEDDVEDEKEMQFQFAKHRKGWFNRMFRVGEIADEQQLLRFKKSLIKKALLKQNRHLDTLAIQVFKNVMSYMGDRSSSKQPNDHAKKLLRNLMTAPAGLRDEAYMQLVKQTTDNPKETSNEKGWELLFYFVSTFPPSKNLRPFLVEYIGKNMEDQSKSERVRVIAKQCADNLPQICEMGQREAVPSVQELEALRQMEPITIKVHLVDMSEKTFNVTPYTLVSEVEHMLYNAYNLQVRAPFCLYEAGNVKNTEKVVEGQSRVLDVLASWENDPLQVEAKVSERIRKEAAKKAKISGVQEIVYNHFLFRAKLVLKTSNRDVMQDKAAIDLLYLQAVSDVTSVRYPSNDKDITVLSALQLQALHGDFKNDTHFAGWLRPQLTTCMPEHYLLKKKKLNEAVAKEWEQKILDKYQRVAGFTSHEAQLNYLDYIQEWTFYGSTFFNVEQYQFKDYPPLLTLGINSEGIILMHPEKKTVLENYPFSDIVTWGHSDEKFIVVVGNIVQQRKLIFKTLDGKPMNSLISAYVKFKVSQKGR
jgi:hypothetical protein